MLMEFYSGIPPLLVQFVVTVAFSFVVGLEFRSYHHANDYRLHFGSTRTFVLIGVLGFILYTMDASRYCSPRVYCYWEVCCWFFTGDSPQKGCFRCSAPYLHY